MASPDPAPQQAIRWDECSNNIPQAIDRVAAHPRFAEASRALAAGMLKLAKDDRVLDGTFKDAGRYFAAMTAFALDNEGGLTLPRLAALAERSGLLSRGRARAMLQFLEYSGYLDRKAKGPRGADIYAPTQSFRTAWDRQFLVSLQAASLLEPDLMRILDPHAIAARRTYGRIHSDGILQAGQGEQVVVAFRRVFMNPYAGNHIAWLLIGLSDDFPPRKAGPVSISGLARLSGTSRQQVGRILRHAQEEGLTESAADGMISFNPLARSQLCFFYAIQFVHILMAATQAMRQHLPHVDA
jgi:hypothetical protein